MSQEFNFYCLAPILWLGISESPPQKKKKKRARLQRPTKVALLIGELLGNIWGKMKRLGWWKRHFSFYNFFFRRFWVMKKSFILTKREGTLLCFCQSPLLFFKEKKGCLNLQINSFNMWAELEELKLPFLFYVWNRALLHMRAFLSPSLAWNWNRPTWELIWQTGLSPESLWKLNLMKSHTHPKPAG